MTRSWLAPAFFSLTAIISAATNASESYRDAIELIRQQGDQIRESADINELLPKNPPEISSEHRAYASEMLRDAQSKALAQGNVPEEQRLQRDCSQPVTYIFISYSIEKPVLKDIMALASGREDVVLLMRGIPERTTIGKGVMQMQLMAREFDPMPNIVLNPTPFQQHGVDAVPTMVRVNGGEWNAGKCEQDMVVKVTGIANPDYIERALEKGDLGDHGQRGPTVEIAERDLIEVMKERVAKIDWESKKKGALARSFQNMQVIPLPPATDRKTRRVEAAVGLPKDIKDTDGNVLIAAGTIVNPLQQRPFDVAMVVFDATSAEKVKQAVTLGQRYREQGWRIVYLFTDIDRLKGWSELRSLQDTLDGPVYKLTPEVKSRFDISVAPSVVTADQTHFIVDEFRAAKEEYHAGTAADGNNH